LKSLVGDNTQQGQKQLKMHQMQMGMVVKPKKTKTGRPLQKKSCILIWRNALAVKQVE
jgi:hypothetical protein